MIKQYPHFLFVHVVSEAVQDDQGNWSDPSDKWVLHSICREETNGKGSLINGVDGKAITFSSNVFMPKTAQKIKDGTEVLVSETNDPAGTVRIKGQSLKFDVGQLNCRLWV
ncbi:hypothetical protein JZU61_04260 [bacterium]|jgi:hypothetical protein|nr:hypothetical protein [bacterium]